MVYHGKGPNKFWGQQVVFGTKFLKFGPKMATLVPVHLLLYKTTKTPIFKILVKNVRLLVLARKN